MWCFCRKKSSAVDDEQDEGFVKIASDEVAETKCITLLDGPGIETVQLNNEKSVEQDGCLNELFETKSYDSENVGIPDYVNVSAISENLKDEQINKNSSSKNNLKAGVNQIKSTGGVVRAIVHSPFASNIDSSESSNFGSRKKLIANDEKKLIANDGKKLIANDEKKLFANDEKKLIASDRKKLIVECKSLFSSHSTQTENGVLPAPLMKRREKTKSTEMTENLISRNSNVPLDLSGKAVSPVHITGVGNASNHSKTSTNTADTYHYENLPSGVKAALEVVESRKDFSHPLDLSLSGQSSSNTNERKFTSSSKFNSNFESCPLNLSKKSCLPNGDKDMYFDHGRFNSTKMSLSSLRSNETESCVTSSSKPDLLSNVDDDDDDYSLFDEPKVNYTNAVYDSTASNNNINFPTASVSSDCSRNLIQLNSFPKGFGQEQGEWYVPEPQLAHSNSYVHQKKTFPTGQYRYHHSQQFHQPHSQHAPVQQHLSSVIGHHQGYQPSYTATPPITNPVTFKRDLSCSSSFNSVTNQSIGISYCNPSYQNFSLDKESQYAVLDGAQNVPVYNNLAPCVEGLYHVYDDKTGASSTQAVYENISPEPENFYFAYDNNTYIPPHRLKKKENMYENQRPDPVILADSHTYSTIGSEMTKSSSCSELAVQLTPDRDISCKNSKVETSVDSCASKSVKESTSDVTALNLVKPPDIPLPVKVKPSPKAKYLSKQFKSNNCPSKNGKLNNGKTGNNSKGKSKEVSKKDVSIPELLRSPSSQDPRSGHHKPPSSKQKGKKLSVTSLSSAPQETPQKVVPSFDASSKKFSSLTDMEKKDSPSSLLPSPNAQHSKRKSARSLLASLSFRGEKKPGAIKKSESSKVLGSRNKWGNSSAASLGSIASLASSSSSLSNYVHPPSVASEGGILSSNRKDFYDNGSHCYYTPPCLAAHPSDQLMQENFKLLRQCPWYWGALDVRRAEDVLSGRSEGSFLVRDSSDESCIISLSFRSLQATHHTRVEYNDGFLSFHVPSSITQESQRLPIGISPSISSSSSSSPSPTGHCNIVEFIAKAIEDSTQSCNNLSVNNTCWLYLERPRSLGVDRVPVKLFSPVSRVQEVSKKPASLQLISRRKIISMTKKEFISSLALSHYLRAYLLIEFISEGPIN